MNRRQLLAALAGLAAMPAWAHTPYRQWAVFRQRFLLITTTRDDRGSDDLGEEIARILLEQLPASHAQVSRARDWKTLASLLVTQQTELAVMAHARAAALFAGAPPYQDFGAAPLRTIVRTDHYAMVCRTDFPNHHAFLLAEALMRDAGVTGFQVPVADSGLAIPAHPGALLFAQGGALPVAPDNEKEVRRAQ